MEKKVIHVDFENMEAKFISDLEDAINGLVDVVYDHYELPIAEKLAKGIALALTDVAVRVEENIKEKPPIS